MPKICILCDHCRQIPLAREEIGKGVEPLLRCRSGRFDLREMHLLPKWNLKTDMCPDFEGELEDLEEIQERPPRPERDSSDPDAPSGAGRSRHLNLRDILPPELLREIQQYVRGPRMVYVPSPPDQASLHQKILNAFKATSSIRGTASLLKCSRNTVRRVVRDPDRNPAGPEGETDSHRLSSPSAGDASAFSPYEFQSDEGGDA